MKRRLPRGEETLPIIERKGRFKTPNEIPRRRMFIFRPKLDGPASDELLIERVRLRIAQGRESTIYRIDYELSPQSQLEHMKLKDDIGLELLQAERGLLNEERKIIEEEMK